MALRKEINFFLRQHILSGLSACPYCCSTAYHDQGLEWHEQKFMPGTAATRKVRAVLVRLGAAHLARNLAAFESAPSTVEERSLS